MARQTVNETSPTRMAKRVFSRMLAAYRAPWYAQFQYVSRSGCALAST
jgi:hypothetical protein